SYRLVADAVIHHRDVYDLTGRYPYLPLHLHLLAGAGWLAGRTGLPFELAVKLPAIVADAALAGIVAWAASAQGRRYNAPALAMVYALNPLSLLVTAYHGQFDAIPVALLIGGRAILAARPRRWTVPLAGLLLGLAVAEKTWPALLAPLLLMRVRGMRRQGQFVAGTALPVLLCLALYEARVPGGALRAVHTSLTYQGYLGTWGFSELLVHVTASREAGIAWAMRLGPWVMLAALALSYAAALRLRRDSDRLALVISAVYAAASGWGVHWLSWLVPVALIGARRWAAAYLGAAGAYMMAVYLGFGGITWGFAWFTDSLAPITWARAGGLCLWAAISTGALGYCLAILWHGWGPALRTVLAGRRLVLPRPAFRPGLTTEPESSAVP
ncbi:MAG: hypothetical protein C4290_09970, partial [Chloroflexota bacterium]